MKLSKAQLDDLNRRVLAAENALNEARRNKRLLAEIKLEVRLQALQARNARLIIEPAEQATLRKIRHTAIKLMQSTGKAQKTIKAALLVAYLREHCGYSVQDAKAKAAKKLGLQTGRLYEYYNRYLVQRKFAINELKEKK